MPLPTTLRRGEMELRTMMVFTRESVDEMLWQGGSASWKLNEKRAQIYSYLICVRNNLGNKDGVEPNGQAFLIAKIKNIVRSPNPQYPDRYMIAFDQYAEIQIDIGWEGRRNPVYYKVEPNKLGLNISELQFLENSKKIEGYNSSQTHGQIERGKIQSLTIDEAKQGLAKTFSINMDAIEITIRV
jgi:hypothetical protein